MCKILGLSLLFLTSFLAAAQDTPRFEVFGGYSYANTSRILSASRPNLNGWNAALTFNFNRWLGVTGDFGGYYRSSNFGFVQPVITPCATLPCPITLLPFNGTIDTKIHTFLVGPQVAWRNHSRITPFGHVLFGLGNENVGLNLPSPFALHLNSNAFSMAMGGGVDVKLTSRLAWRVQPDYLQTDFLHATQKNLRVSTGLVFRFGSK